MSFVLVKVNTMSGFVKQILLDLHKMPLDQKVDIINAIEVLYKARVFTYNDIQILNAYLSGYTQEEISIIKSYRIDYVEAVLERMMKAIEAQSRYTDAQLVNRVTQSGKYKPYNLTKLSKYLYEYGTTFSSHEPKLLS